LGQHGEAQSVLDSLEEIVRAVVPADLDGNAEQLLLAALVALEIGDYDRSFDFLDSYRQYRPEHLWAGRMMAKILMAQDKPSQASRLLVRLSAINPRDPETLVMLGDANAAMHDFDRAEWYYRSAMELVEQDSALLTRLSRVYEKRGDLQAAIAVMETSVDQNPQLPLQPSVFLSRLYLKEGQLDKASEILDRVLATSPTNLLARHIQGVIALQRGDTDGGRRIFEALLQQDSGFRPARLTLVKLDIASGRLDEAESRLADAMADAPEDIQLLEASADLALARGEDSQAIALLERVRTIDSEAISASISLVSLYLRLGETDKALDIALGLASQRPRSVPVLLSLASVYLAVRDVVSLNQTFEKAKTAAGSNPKLLFDVGIAEAEAGALAQSAATLRRVVERKPDWWAARLQLAHVLFRQKDFSASETEVAAVLGAEPANVSAITLMADLKTFQRRYKEAIQLYREALALADMSKIAIRLHTALIRDGRPKEAVDLLDSRLQKQPNAADVIRVLADTHYALGDLDSARDLYQRLVVLRPDDPLALNNLAALLEETDAERALKTALRAYELAPENPSILDTLGWMLVQLGELDKGLQYLREAAIRDSRSAEIRYHLGVALNEFGSTDEARRELEKALELDPMFRHQADVRRRLQLLQ
jgi:putative PEP-CTERM system TPR-repeat lipoprotein